MKKQQRTQGDRNKKKKLALRTETVRKLNELPSDQLAQVAGGATPVSRPTNKACM